VKAQTGLGQPFNRLIDLVSDFAEATEPSESRRIFNRLFAKIAGASFSLNFFCELFHSLSPFDGAIKQ
jgi:hypothetical protein